MRVACSPKSCSEAKKYLKIVQVAKKVPGRICLTLRAEGTFSRYELACEK